MIVKVASDGTIVETVRFHYFQGSNDVQTVTLFAPYDSSYKVLVNFRLPDEVTYTGIMNYQNWEENGLHAWQYPIKAAITAIAGKVEVAFNISKGDQIIPTAIDHITIEESVEDGWGISDPTSFHELLKLIDEKIEESGGGNVEVWIKEEEPDTSRYNTWFRPVSEIEPQMMIFKMSEPIGEVVTLDEEPESLGEVIGETDNSEPVGEVVIAEDHPIPAGDVIEEEPPAPVGEVIMEE
jgi:hypothetical protein